MTHSSLHLFEGYGIELEYMIVDRDTLNVTPIAHHLLCGDDGEPTSEVEYGEFAWSNELTQHVIEIKTNGPAKSLSDLEQGFQSQIEEIHNLLAKDNACLLPTAMHPWMNPDSEMKLWPYDYSVVYETFHRIFDCRGHGWANLQSMHINLPFSGDEEFARLHAAVRLLLPILPGLAASSPFCDGKTTGFLDHRLRVYSTNARKIHSVTGMVIPEPVFTQHDYEQRILQPMYEDIAKYDQDGVLQAEFLNARGAIARFDRNAIEIRVLDVQESPVVDISIAAFIVSTLKAMVDERWTSTESQKTAGTAELRAIFNAALQSAGATVITDEGYLQHFGLNQSTTVQQIWAHLFSQLHEKIDAESPTAGRTVEALSQEGCLAQRILKVTGDNPSPNELLSTYQQLADCLRTGSMFGVTGGVRH